ncbi:hypothetical protein GOP47_0002011 [Adiantum capillus-veneris]|uniref:TOG domain-containing protein n=1 Tax=Adiantum capillus-veneris TaxID=13818 RepID=A0A9D4ZNM9_ADICA|nr:hypothetical protein GOP47_0002011 [Adiantum capillus-veneris]
MAQTGRGVGQRAGHTGTTGRPSSYAGSVGGGPPSHLLLMELKHRMLAALAKLSDRDTQQLAVEDLQKLVEVLSPEGLSMCLSCLYDTDTQQKSTVKRECVRLLATLAARHGPLLIPHLPKIVSSIVRRLKDPDTGVRDACIDAMGSLASHIVYLLPPLASKAYVGALAGTTSPPRGTPRSNMQSDTNLHSCVHANEGACMQKMQTNGPVRSNSGPPFTHNNHQDPVTAHVQPHPSLGNAQSSNMQELNAFVKPLFDALSEQNRSVQSGAAMCLARVITSVQGNPHSPSTSRLSQRVCKLLTNPSFLAKAALLPVISSLCQVGAVYNQAVISTMVPCVHDALESHDWATRKTAAETLTCMGSSLGAQLTTFKSGTLLLLESCRFDKVKPVRDSVQDAIQTWKTLTGVEREMGSSTCSTPSANGSTGSGSNAFEKLPGILKKRSAALTDKKPNARFFNKMESQSSDDWHIEVAVPRSCPPPSVTGYKGIDTNGLSRSNTNECKSLCRQTDSFAGGSSFMEDHGIENSRLHHVSGDTDSKEVLRLETCDVDDDNSNMLDDMSSYQNSKTEITEILGVATERSLALSNASDIDSQLWDITSPSLRSPSGHMVSNGKNNYTDQVDAANWLMVQKQLSQLEYQQSNIMDLFQEFMGSSRNSMFALEARIKVLERVVEDISQDLDIPASDCLDRYNNEMSDHLYGDKYFSSQQDEQYSMQSSMSRNGRMDGLSPCTSSASKAGANFMMNELTYNVSASRWKSNADADVREEHWSESPTNHFESVEENAYRMEPHRIDEPCHKDKDQELMRRVNNALRADVTRPSNGNLLRGGIEKENDDHADPEQIASRRVWDRESIISAALGNHGRPGEGPSARSVWQASKDEATLAAIRGAGEEDSEPNLSTGTSSTKLAMQVEALHIQALDEGKKSGEVGEKASNSASRCSSSSNIAAGNNKVDQEGKRAYWRLWSRAVELVQLGNMDCAYMDVLGSGDELMLVRLMNKTGPVLEKLSSTTANEMLQNVAQLLRQHSFFDFSLPWVQQVADLVMDMGANNLDILSNVKRELIQSIQEASHMEIPNDWLGNSINELCSILMDAWSTEQDIH